MSETKKLELAAFLGNPGAQYAGNRHNAGRLLAKALVKAIAEAIPSFPGLEWKRKFKGLYAEQPIQACNPALRLLMPETFMNASGESIATAASFYKIAPESIIVVHDELELPLGTVSFKFGGGLGGHNGLRSTKACLGTADFWRLRIGIGRPGDREPGKGGEAGKHGDVYGWVLSDFSPEEAPLLQTTLEEAAKALLQAWNDGPETLLPQWAKKKLPPPLA